MLEFFLLVYIVGLTTSFTLIYFGFKRGELSTYGHLIMAITLAVIPLVGIGLTTFILIEEIGKSDFWNKPIKKGKK